MVPITKTVEDESATKKTTTSEPVKMMYSLADKERVERWYIPVWEGEIEECLVGIEKSEKRGIVEEERKKGKDSEKGNRKSRFSRMFMGGRGVGGSGEGGKGGVERVRADAVGRNNEAASWSKDSDVWG